MPTKESTDRHEIFAMAEDERCAGLRCWTGKKNMMDDVDWTKKRVRGVEDGI